MDKRARDILFKTYWSAKGWIMGPLLRKTDPLDFAYAKAQGVMFDPLPLSFEDFAARLIRGVACGIITAATICLTCYTRIRCRNRKQKISGYLSGYWK